MDQKEQEPSHHQVGGVRNNQRYFKVTNKGRAPKVTRVWGVEEKPWYIRYAWDWILLLIAIPLVIAKASISDEGLAAYGIDMILIWIIFLWLVTLPPGEHER